MNEEYEAKLTLKFVGVAVLTASLAFFLTPTYTATLDIEGDVGASFYPEFKDLDKVKGLEVHGYNSNAGEVKTFKVQNKDGRWTIPSHENYPADAVERMAKVTASLIDLKKNQFVSAQVKDHKKFKVLDPTENKNSEDAKAVKNLGTRVNLLDDSGEAVASFIFGEKLESKAGFRYVRVPGDNRVYATAMENVDLSTNFSDWIERDLLKLNPGDSINKISILNYHFDGRMKDLVIHDLNKKDGKWTMKGLAKDEKPSAKATGLEGKLADLVITGVRPKPDSLREWFENPTRMPNQIEQIELSYRGFYLNRTQGGQLQLTSNSGEVIAVTKNGLRYRLWFGNLAYGDTDQISGGGGILKKGEDAKGKGPADNRFLMIVPGIDNSQFPVPPKPVKKPGQKEEDFKKEREAYSRKMQEFATWSQNANRALTEANKRFARWYYLISEKQFRELRPKRVELVDKEKPKKDDHKGHDHGEDDDHGEKKLPFEKDPKKQLGPVKSPKDMKKEEPKKAPVKKEEPKKEEPKKMEPKKDEVKKEGPKKEAPKDTTPPKKEEPKKPEPSKDAPKKN